MMDGYLPSSDFTPLRVDANYRTLTNAEAGFPEKVARPVRSPVVGSFVRITGSSK
jgi:hypothetical protein